MLGLSNIRLIAYGVIALALASLVAHDHWMSRQYKAQKVETAAVTAELVTERKNRAIEQADRKQADEIVKPVEIKVARIATRPDPVGVYCRPSGKVRASTESGSPPSVADTAVDRGPEAPR